MIFNSLNVTFRPSKSYKCQKRIWLESQTQGLQNEFHKPMGDVTVNYFKMTSVTVGSYQNVLLFDYFLTFCIKKHCDR